MFKIHFFFDIFFVQNLILSKFCMNDNIIKTYFHNMKFDLKGHVRSHKALLCLKIRFFLDIYFCLKFNLTNTIYDYEYQHKV